MIFTSLRIRGFQSIADSGVLELGDITILVGRNNTGKSALLRAVYLLQEGSPHRVGDIRIGVRVAEIDLAFQRFTPFQKRLDVDYLDVGKYRGGGFVRATLSAPNNLTLGLAVGSETGNNPIRQWPSREPYNLIYPSLARRHQQHYQQQPTQESASTISPSDANLVARVASLATAQIPEAENFRRLCKEVLGFTVDVLLGLQNNQNQQLGIQVNRFESIPLESMGSGVSGVLGLLVSLCDAQDKLFLIEEPENDLHPQALKALLDAIIEASKHNQFIISTHSSIVLTRLGAAPGAVVLQTESDNLRLPATTYDPIASPEDRMEVLRKLGYELADFHLGGGWILFEESSAERIVREWLIPWFAPSLRNLYTVAAKGTSRVTALAQALGEMLVFAHREPIYRHQAWVIVDGDQAGKEVVQKLRSSFPDWPMENFTHWSESEFESYYPKRFEGRVNEIRDTIDRGQRQELKKDLLHEVIQWIDEDQDVARSEFQISAADVIRHLARIAQSSRMADGA